MSRDARCRGMEPIDAPLLPDLSPDELASLDVRRLVQALLTARHALATVDHFTATDRPDLLPADLAEVTWRIDHAAEIAAIDRVLEPIEPALRRLATSGQG